MEKQLHESVEAAHIEQAIRTQEFSPKKAKEKTHKHRGIFHLHHHSKDEKEEEKKKEGSKREKISAAMVGLGATLKKIKHPRDHGGGAKEEQEGGGEGEEEEREEDESSEEEEEEGDDVRDEEEGGKFSAFITMIAEAFEE
ncbi:PREDICTED: ABC transporter F family member 4-like [Camelina sativa]|uniref:ABC transporter F family member 4-like n=1 Tax=Camelina sativa TaxID=90675 RepID=A0ABM0VF05_CAMSA|nr:PREDICTED: ABC transporter F family member 4-like [Camelina sativa]